MYPWSLTPWSFELDKKHKISNTGHIQSDSDSNTQNSDKILTTFYWKFWLNSNQIMENSDSYSKIQNNERETDF